MKKLLIFLFLISFYGNSQEFLLFETLYPDDNLITTKYHNGQIKFQRITTELNQENGYPSKWVDREWYFNGNNKIETHYIDGKKHGLFREWYSNGDIKIEENYIDGKKHGLLKEWYENQNIKSEENYIDGKKHGLFREWYSNRNIKMEANYFTGKKILFELIKTKYGNNYYGEVKRSNFILDGALHGKFNEWYENGNLKIDGNFSQNQKIGKWNHYYLNGNTKIMRKHSVYDETLYPLENGKVYRKWNSDGEETEYINFSDNFNKQIFVRYCLNIKKKSIRGISKLKNCGEIPQIEIRPFEF